MAAAKILIVDDDAMMLGMVYRMLNRRNYDVVSASSPRQAVEIVRTCLFVDVVISDFYMPVMTGGELISMLYWTVKSLLAKAS